MHAANITLAQRHKGARTPCSDSVPEQRLLTAQHVLRMNDKLTGPFSQALIAWPPEVGKVDGTSVVVKIDTDLTPDGGKALEHPEDLAFLTLPAGATGSTPTGLLPYTECAKGLKGLDIYGYISGDDLINAHKGIVDPAPFRGWSGRLHRARSRESDGAAPGSESCPSGRSAPARSG